MEQDHRITVMDKIDWAGVEVNVCLGSWHLSLIAVASHASIKVLFTPPHCTKHADFDKGPKCLHNQGWNKKSSNLAIPVDTEVSLSTDLENKGQRTNAVIKVFERSIVKYDQNCSVYELTDENCDHSNIRLFGHRLEAQALNHLN